MRERAEAVAVFDVGKTNIKLVLFDGNLDELWQAAAPNNVRAEAPYPHADTAAIEGFWMEGLRQANSRHPIGTVIVTTHGATGVLIDDAGPVLPVMDYEFPGLESVAAEYSEHRPPFEETLSPPQVNGLNLGRQLFYLQRKFPRAFGRARHFLMYPQYWAWLITRVAASEATSLGCHTDLWAPARGALSSIVAARGWEHLFPQLRKAWEVLGPVAPKIVATTGLSERVRVLCGIHDSNASLLPHLAERRERATMISTGTWILAMAIGAGPANIDPDADMLAYTDVWGRPVPAAKFMAGREVGLILGGASSGADKEDVAAVLAAGVLAKPCFGGNGGPYRDRPGRIEGELPQRPGARAALAAIYAALMTEDLLLRLEADKGPLIVEGGFTENAAYCAVLAGLRPKQELFVAESSGGTALGAAMLGSWPKVSGLRKNVRKQKPWDLERLTPYRETWRAGLIANPH